jgi:transcriptional regulator with XRE-family HTH domain
MEETVKEAIGKRVEKACADAGITLSALADASGVHRSTITRIVHGERRPEADTLGLMAPVLGLSVEQLVQGTDAEDRVEEAKRLIARSHYEEAVRQIILFEQKTRELDKRLDQKEQDLVEERSRRQQAERRTAEATTQVEALSHACQLAEKKADTYKRDAEFFEQRAQQYQRAFEQAYSDARALEATLEQLKQAVHEGAAASKEGATSSRLGAIFAGVAAVASVAAYLDADTPIKKASASNNRSKNTTRSAPSIRTTKKRKSV